MGYCSSVYYPKRTDKELYKNLTHQCTTMGVNFYENCPSLKAVDENYGLIIDAVFGFSFKPPVRAEFIELMSIMRDSNLPLAR